ncbi:MAG: HAD-IIIA family hydrolase [Proteobacteria bacterium]|nr:HAD-IIIA family hydrolase [Desulfobacula sp.]MBU3954383.1 HAD-IIIA family hydrolase [Pseudomonadota bacterium]MBU4131173.1 HAD-IIIA family hydrolase [Pseudomonadota bacterium]
MEKQSGPKILNPKKLTPIKLLLLDVDGVLTDGQITYTDTGEQIKSFDSKDGLGLRLIMDNGIRVGIVTGRKSNALAHRCRNLGIDLVFDGTKDKARALAKIIEQTGICARDIAFVGDDLIDLPAMIRVGVSFTVPDAPKEVKDRADFITSARGGHGAVREICEAILKSQGLWDQLLSKYLS